MFASHYQAKIAMLLVVAALLVGVLVVGLSLTSKSHRRTAGSEGPANSQSVGSQSQSVDVVDEATTNSDDECKGLGCLFSALNN